MIYTKNDKMKEKAVVQHKIVKLILFKVYFADLIRK